MVQYSILVYFNGSKGKRNDYVTSTTERIQLKENRTPPACTTNNLPLSPPMRWTSHDSVGTDQTNNGAVVTVVLWLCVCESNNIVYHSHSRITVLLLLFLPQQKLISPPSNQQYKHGTKTQRCFIRPRSLVQSAPWQRALSKVARGAKGKTVLHIILCPSSMSALPFLIDKVDPWPVTIHMIVNNSNDCSM